MPINTNISSLYEFTLQQMAAESYFEGILPSDADGIKRALIRGTNRIGYQNSPTDLNDGYPGYTRMTSEQADEFLSKYSIVHQWSDNPSTGTTPGSRPAEEGIDGKPKLNSVDILANTGLSATLIKNKATGEFTLAIRSTESRSWDKGGDDTRDMFGADAKGIAQTGFALAQQDALELYYQWLKDNGKLPAGAKLNVTGYSLGGNLATVFTEMHQGNTDVQFGETVTMNGAGRGQWDFSVGTLKDMVSYYHDVLNNPTTVASRPLNSQETLIRNQAIAAAGNPYSDKNIYNDPRHIWAVTATQAKFNLNSPSGSNEFRTGTLSADATANLSATYKSADPANTTTVVSNTWGITAQDAGNTTNTYTGTDQVETLNGGPGNDELIGLAGNDKLYSNDGNDQLDGGDGDDEIDGGKGVDTLEGGAGSWRTMGGTSNTWRINVQGSYMWAVGAGNEEEATPRMVAIQRVATCAMNTGATGQLISQNQAANQSRMKEAA